MNFKIKTLIDFKSTKILDLNPLVQIKNLLNSNSAKTFLRSSIKKSNSEPLNSKSLEFLVAGIVNYKLYIFKLANPICPNIISHTCTDIPATCLGDSDVIKLDEFSEIVLGQIIKQSPEVNLPTYLLLDPEYFSSDTTAFVNASNNSNYLSLSPFVPANTLFTTSKYKYSKGASQFFESISKNLGSIAKLHNQSNVDLTSITSAEFARLDFVNRDFLEKITSPFAQISLPICNVTSLDFPIIDSIQRHYKGFNFYLSCGQLSSIFYIIHSDGFLRSLKIPVGIQMYHYPINGTVEYDQLLARLSSVVNKKIKEAGLELNASNIIISGLDIESIDVDPSLFRQTNLKHLSLSEHIRSLNLKNIEKLKLTSENNNYTPTIVKILFSSSYLSSMMKM